MAPVTDEFKRLQREYVARKSTRMAVASVAVVLGAFVLFAALYRVYGWAPAFLLYVDDRPSRTVLILVGAVVLAPLLGRLLVQLLRPSLREIARTLDREKGLADGADAALDVERGPTRGPLASVLTSRVASVASATTASSLWGLIESSPASRLRRRLTRAFPWVMGIFVFLLLYLPGNYPAYSGVGAGEGLTAGIGIRPKPWDADRGGGLEPEDADLWLEKHAKLELLVPDPLLAPLKWRARLTSDAPFPLAYRGALTVGIDAAGPFGPCGSVEVPEGAKGNDVVNFDPLDFGGTRAVLTPGTHKAFARLAPTVEPWKRVVVSPTIDVIVPPPQPNGGGANEPPPQPQPKPQPKQQPKPQPQPQPEAPPAPSPSKGEKKPPEVQLHDEVVTPLAREGEKVKKDEALVAVKDPEAGIAAPKAMPLSEALRDYEHVVERAVLGEHVLPADKEFLKRYLEALRKAAGLDRAAGSGGGK